MKKLILLTCIAGLFTSFVFAAKNEEQAIPFLIPFNQVLFNDYCRRKAELCEKEAEKLFMDSAFSSIITTMALSSALYAGTKISAHWQNWSNSHGFGESLWNGGTLTAVATFSAFNIISLPGKVQRMCQRMQALFSNTYDEQIDEWNRLLCTSCDEQEALWHSIIYERFGKPLVQGCYEHGMNYTLQFNKKSGIGRVIVDPYTIEAVQLILGIHDTQRDDCTCDVLHIIKTA